MRRHLHSVQQIRRFVDTYSHSVRHRILSHLPSTGLRPPFIGPFSGHFGIVPPYFRRSVTDHLLHGTQIDVRSSAKVLHTMRIPMPAYNAVV
ncbi:hypothetical protein DSM100685_1819 [Bifidobacterium avesanii]|nr:hypothetical protein DSM100685_1819 [Bifidobacterium avesanii]